MRRLAVLTVCLMAISAPAAAQGPYNLNAPVTNLATLFTDLFGPRGLVVDSEATLPGEQLHTAHFNNDFQSNFRQLSTAMVSQLASVPLPSPASGFTFQFDASLGVFQRTTTSFGPILTDRAETIGSRRAAIGFAFQRYKYDTIEGLDLGQVPAVFTHDNAFLLGGREDVVTTLTAIDARISQATTFITLGVTDRLDISLAVPVADVEIKATSHATIRRLGTVNPLTHFYRQSDGEVGEERIFSAAGRATGIGDLMVRVKGTVFHSARHGVAAGADIRLPTGDELNLLGTGTAALQPFLIWSSTFGSVSPHVNTSYKWNGSSVLAGNPSTGERSHFPDNASYAVGADISVNPRLTVAFDLIGQYFIDAERLRAEPFHALDNVSVFPNVVFTRDSFNALNGSIGVKANLLDRLLLDMNLLFKLDENGLRDRVTPLIGLEYSF